MAHELPPLPSTFDPEALLDRLDGDLRLARELLTTYLEEAPAMRAGLRDALNSGDPKRIERAAHSLRGALAAVSAPVAVDLADQLESRSRDGDLSFGQSISVEFEAQLDLLEQELRAYVRGGDGGDGVRS